MINFENLSNEQKVHFEMLAHYGYVVLLSQKFEKNLAALLQGEFARENKGKLPYDKYIEEVARLYKGNLGELLKKLKIRMSITTETEEFLQKALKRRNYLIHDYFYHNESKETVTDGQLSIIQELVKDQAMFSEALNWVDQRCKESLLKIGVTEASFAETVEKNRQAEIAKFRNGEPIEFLPK
jgi:hypothetical protein